jgi:hypothetical protein
MRFERPSAEESKALVLRLVGKATDEIISILGQPARETSARTEERLADGKPRVVEIRRTLTYFDVGPTIHRLKVIERADGKHEFQMAGREISDEAAA